MALQLENLDDRTRRYMLEELERDLASGTLYRSPRLSDRGWTDWPALLRAAIESGNDMTLADSLRVPGRLKVARPRRTGTPARLPRTAAQTLAEGEFNRFYIRGVCRRTVDDGIKEVEVYRAKRVRQPRPESQAKIGTRISAAEYLEDLRTHSGEEPEFGFPRPNSGLSVRLP